MKITVEKEYTTLAALPKVKADMKEFKARYTDNDLLSAFWDAVEIDHPWGHNVISANVESFPGGTDFDNKTEFHVSLITHGWREFCEIDFYCNLDLTVDTRDLMFSPGEKMYSQRVYKLAGA